MTLLTPFGMRLRQERIRLGFNQQEFGEKAGVSKNSISSYEKGERPANVVFLLALADIGVDIGFVLTGNRADGSMTMEQKQLIEMFESLSSRERGAVMSFLTHMTDNAVALASVGWEKSKTVHSGKENYRGQDKG